MSTSTLTHDQTLAAIEDRAMAAMASVMVAMTLRINEVMQSLGERDSSVQFELLDSHMDAADTMLSSLEKSIGQFLIDEITKDFPSLDASECNAVNELVNDLAGTPARLARKAKFQPKPSPSFDIEGYGTGVDCDGRVFGR